MNPVSKLDTYPILKIEDLFATLWRGNCFSKLDLSQVYQQLPLDEESKNYVVINTQRFISIHSFTIWYFFSSRNFSESD